jgi:imidazolonepropionase-like amidohydrolase
MGRAAHLAIAWVVCSLCLSSVTADDQPAADATVAFRGARILTAEGPALEPGVLVIRQGKIVAVGSANDVTIPDGAVIHDVSGKTIIPGMVDTHSHIGIYPRPQVPANSDGNEMTGPVQSGLRAIDAIYHNDPGIKMAVAGGITTANIMPGSGNVIGGQTLYVKLRGNTIEAMRIPDTKVLGGLKMANGENPKGYGRRPQGAQAPVTRMKVAALQREQFIKARDYQRKWAAYRKAQDEGMPAAQPDLDIALEPVVEVLERKRTVHFHTHRADDLLTALRIAEEFEFEIVIQHGTEGYRIVDELVRRKAPVSLTLVDSPGGKMEVAALLEENAAILDKAGVKVAINTDDFITESRFFLRTGAIAVRGGMPEDRALLALTRHPAEMLHLEDRVGSLAKGKDADFVVLSGPPFSVYTQVLETYIDGVRMFDRSQQKQWAYQAGGFALADLSALPQPPAPTKPQPSAQAPAAPKEAPTLSQSPTRFAVFAGRLHTVAKGTIEDGALLIEDGKIRYAGPRAGLDLPAQTPVITAAVVTPGLIDAHAVVPITGALNVSGDQEQDENSDPNQADLRVLDGFNPNEPLLQFLREQGVTVVHATPGRVNVIAGQSGIFHTYGRTAEQMTLKFPAGLLINLGEIPKQTYPGKLPGTRMGTASLVRTALVQAQNDAHKRASAKDEDKRPPRNLKLEALTAALERKIPCVFSAHRADDLDTALRLAKEFNLDAVLDLATEAYLIPDIIAAAKVPVVVHPTMQRVGASLETYNSHVCNAALLADRQIPVVIGTAFEGYVPKSRVLRLETAIAMVNGLGFDRALRAITLDAAHLLGIDDRFGSLEVGKAADIVLYDGDPFENATHVTNTIIGGRVIYDRAEYLKLPFERRALPLTGSGVGCCMGVW